MYPLSVDSKATVALSVSTSQIVSPTSIWSPYLTLHLTILPSVMVGDNAGMWRTWCLGNSAKKKALLLNSKVAERGLIDL